MIRALVFDLGGVLIDYRGMEAVRDLSGGRIDAQEFSRFWSSSVWGDRLYCGECSPEAFAAGAVQELSLSITPAEFLAAFRTWLHGFYPDALELLRDLRARYQLACFSNTNSVDVQRLREEFSIHQQFDRCFFSNEIGLRKPALESYRHVLAQLGLSGEEVAFFDDTLECVVGAREAGMQAHQCMGIESLRASLRRLGFTLL